MIYKINGKVVDQETWEASTEDGIHQGFYDDQTLKYEIPLVNGQRHGIENRYHKSGALECEIPWVNGQRHGIEKWYNENGTLQARDLWANDSHLGPLEHALKEKGRLWFIITFGYIP